VDVVGALYGEVASPAEVEPLRAAHPRARARRRGPRAKTIAVKKITRASLAIEALADGERAELEAARPRTRADCADGERPCPYVGCKYHLYLDVNPETGSIKLNFPDLEVWEMAETCSLDVADRGGITLEEVGEILNLTRERIRQVEVRGLLKLKMVGPGEEPIPGDANYLAPDAEYDAE